jgi:hypothetical protein
MDAVKVSDIFTYPDAWSGGDYELGLELDEAGDVCKTLAAIWSFSGLDGCYLASNLEPCAQQRCVPCDGIDSLVRLNGVAMIGAQELPCSTIVVDNSRRWIFVGLPSGSLFRAFGDEDVWIELLDDWMLRLGRAVFLAVPFRIGVQGFLDAHTYVDSRAVARSGVPAVRGVGYQIPDRGDVAWYPPSRN